MVNRAFYDFIHPDERMQIYNLLTNHEMAQPTSIPIYAQSKEFRNTTCVGTKAKK